MVTKVRFLLWPLILAALGFACTLPWMAGGSNASATMIVRTVSALQTSLVGTQTAQVAQVDIPVPTPTPTQWQIPSFVAPAISTRVNPIVATTALCWQGPGPAYPVVSGIKAGTQLEVLGVGSQVGWLVVKNPLYNDRCWIEVKNLMLDPFFNTGGLKVFNPPPTPGPKVTATPTAT